jgi:hypothetical protein
MRNSFVIFTTLVVITLFYSVRAQDGGNITYAGTASVAATSRSEPIEDVSNLGEPNTPSSAPSGIADSSNSAEPDALPPSISPLPKAVVRFSDSPTSSVQWTSLLKGSMS